MNNFTVDGLGDSKLPSSQAASRGPSPPISSSKSPKNLADPRNSRKTTIKITRPLFRKKGDSAKQVAFEIAAQTGAVELSRRGSHRGQQSADLKSRQGRRRKPVNPDVNSISKFHKYLHSPEIQELKARRPECAADKQMR